MQAVSDDLFQLTADAIKRGRTDPVWFVTEVLRNKPDPWQVELLDAVGDVVRRRMGLATVVNHKGINRITVRAMHGPGKTFGAGMIMAWFGLCFRGLSPCTAPKEKQIATRLWPAFRKVLSKAPDQIQGLVEAKQSRITFCNDPDWGFVPETAREPENLAGFHDDYMLIVVDEASGVNEEIFPVLDGAMSSGIIVIQVMIGNPTRNIGTFHDSHRRRGVKELYFPIHVTMDKAPRVSRKWVEEMRLRYGEDSPVFKVRCLGEFADMDELQLIPLDWLEWAHDGDALDDGSLPRLRVSVDVADGGEDETVITVARHYHTWTHALRQLTFNFPSSYAPIMAADKAEELFVAWGGKKGVDDLVVDGVGVGAGTAGELLKRGHNVVVFKGGQQASDPTRWFNRRVQGYYVARDELRDKHVVIDEACFATVQERDEFDAQMCSIKMRMGKERVDDLETKQDLKRRGIKSPDRADSFMMQFADQATRVTGGVPRGGEGSEVYAPESEVADGAAYLT